MQGCSTGRKGCLVHSAARTCAKRTLEQTEDSKCCPETPGMATNYVILGNCNSESFKQGLSSGRTLPATEHCNGMHILPAIYTPVVQQG